MRCEMRCAIVRIHGVEDVDYGMHLMSNVDGMVEVEGLGNGFVM